MIVSVRHCDQIWKICNEQNRITIRHTKIHDSAEKKLKSIIRHSQVPSTSKQCLTNPKKAFLSFKFTQVMSGSQEQKERTTASTVTTFFLEKKSLQGKFASATIAHPVEVMKGITLYTIR